MKNSSLICIILILIFKSLEAQQEQSPHKKLSQDEIDEILKDKLLVDIPGKGLLILAVDQNEDHEVFNDLKRSTSINYLRKGGDFDGPKVRQEEGDGPSGVETATSVTNGVLKIIQGVLLGDLRKVIDGSFSYVDPKSRPHVVGSYNSIVGITTPKPTTTTAKATTKSPAEDKEKEKVEEKEAVEGEEDGDGDDRVARQLELTQENGRILEILNFLLGGPAQRLSSTTTTPSSLFPNGGGLFAPILQQQSLEKQKQQQELQKQQILQQIREQELILAQQQVLQQQQLQNQYPTTTIRTFLPNLPSSSNQQQQSNSNSNSNSNRITGSSIPNINNGLTTLLNGVFAGDINRILSGSFIFAPNRVQNVASNVLDSVFGNNRIKPGQTANGQQSGTVPYLPIK